MRLMILGCLAAVGLAASGLSTPVRAQQAPTGMAEVYRAMTPTVMAKLLEERDYSSVKRDEKAFAVTTESDFNYNVELVVCDVEGQPRGCLGIHIYATWTLEPGTVAKVRPAINTFNEEYRIGKVLMADDLVLAERYVITDGGVTLDHISTELDTFEATADQLWVILSDIAEKVSPTSR